MLHRARRLFQLRLLRLLPLAWPPCPSSSSSSSPSLLRPRGVQCAPHQAPLRSSSDKQSHPGRRPEVGKTPRPPNVSEEGKRSIARAIFNSHRNPDTETLRVGRITEAIFRTGIRESDPRLKSLFRGLRQLRKQVGESRVTLENLELDFPTFSILVDDNLSVLSQIFCNTLTIPEFAKFSESIETIFENCRKNDSGKIADYIPQLAKRSRDTWACSICTVDGQRLSLGDVDHKFTLQSCSKPFTYAICLNELGSEEVHKYVSHEPSGKSFNEICLDSKFKPHNPMLNAGAIMIAALALSKVKPKMQLPEKFEFMKHYLQCIAGHRHVGFNNAVFLSERTTSFRNFAMAYYMRQYDCFPPTVKFRNILDMYFQFCSMELDTEALAVMGATFANGGICPTTWEKVLSPRSIRDVLSLMYSCGMYNYSGQFAFQVGLPAKSGVSGNLLVVIPNLMAIALYSPPLDEIGNSVRGLQFCEELVEHFNFHQFDNIKYAEEKSDPTVHELDDQGLSRVTLMFAATSGDVFGLQKHYLQGHDLGTPDYDGRTPLHAAAMSGQLKSVEFLLHIANVEPDPTDRWNRTPLDDAKRFAHSEVIRFIEEFKARLDGKNKDKEEDKRGEEGGPRAEEAKGEVDDKDPLER